jgi:acetylornithine/succinyldiaminopimelate/putrescine aminotransferase
MDAHKATIQSGCVEGSRFVEVRRSLRDLLGASYMEALCSARAFFGDGLSAADLDRVEGAVDFFPADRQAALSGLVDRVGTQVLNAGLSDSPAGAGSAAFQRATSCAAAPLSACGCYRIGEDGRLYLAAKSEHYHTPLGHAFPGYALLDRARQMGVPNATHNNTRGFITRLLEQELIRTANGLQRDDVSGLRTVLATDGNPYLLNRVLNLETGSLAVEAALKMVLARFYRMQDDMPEPPYHGRIPVIMVMGNDDGGLEANYHGTTILNQALRGMWPGLNRMLEQTQAWKVVPIRPNDIGDMERAFNTFERHPYKIAAFFHEIIMMNYGARRLTPEFLTHAHELCRAHDVPTIVDEIQSCMWAPQLYLFRDYGLSPSFVAVGKGFPGGEYPASRLLFSSAMDVMPQFGALVTNGQEELASLAYLVTMEWAQANAAVTAALGAYYHDRLRALASNHRAIVDGIDGWSHMSALRFKGLDAAQAFVRNLRAGGLDVSAQTYKADCPPVVLTKLPLIADRCIIDAVLDRMENALSALENKPATR